MYTRSYHENGYKKNNDIPVQMFGDSFSADAYIKSESSLQHKKEIPKQIDTQPQPEEHENKTDLSDLKTG